MATYVILGRLTGEGIESIGEGPERLEEVKRAFADRGVETKAFYLTFGSVDFVHVVEADDDETVAAAVLAAAAKGNAGTETLRAFTEDEYRRIAGAV